MLSKFFRSLLVSLVLAIVTVSYTEAWQVQLFSPLREQLVLSSAVVSAESTALSPAGTELKASPDGYYVNPWQIASAAAPVAARALRSNCVGLMDDDRRRLAETAQYFYESAEYREHETTGSVSAVWPYPIRFNYGLNPGWISGMVQARVAKVMAGAALCTEGAEAAAWAKLARSALETLEARIDDGGTLVAVPGGNWYEEYAQAGVDPPLVLNGHVYAVLSLEKLRAFDARADMLFRSGVSALLENLHIYNAVTWSYYDRLGTPANNIYQQRLHARQMSELFELTGDPLFLRYHRIFSLQRLSPVSSLQRIATKPSRFLGFLLAVNTLFFSFSWLLAAWAASKSKSPTARTGE